MFHKRHAPPRKKQAPHVYSQLHFDERIRPAVETEITRMTEAGETEAMVQTINRITKVCWESESEEFQTVILGEVERIYDEAKAAYTALTEEMASQEFVAE
jgi:hypothetical protein